MFDTEKFIYHVEKLTPLYDVRCSDYSNRQVKAKCWNEVGEAMYDNWNEITQTDRDNKGKFVGCYVQCYCFVYIAANLT